MITISSLVFSGFLLVYIHPPHNEADTLVTVDRAQILGEIKISYKTAPLIPFLRITPTVHLGGGWPGQSFSWTPDDWWVDAWVSGGVEHRGMFVECGGRRAYRTERFSDQKGFKEFRCGGGIKW